MIGSASLDKLMKIIGNFMMLQAFQIIVETKLAWQKLLKRIVLSS
jgi:hypothetical protein